MARAASKAVGEIRSIQGMVKAVDPQGNERVLSAGDKVFADETVLANGGTALIGMPGGGFATVGGNDILVLANLPGVSDGANAMAPDQIQALIAAGADPSDIADATAAGGYEEAGEPGEGQHDFVVVDQLAARGALTPGFETGTFGDVPPRHWEYDGRYLEVPEDYAEAPVIPLPPPGIAVPDPADPDDNNPENPDNPRPGHVAPAVTEGTATVWESMLAHGSANETNTNQATVQGEFTVQANGGETILTIEGQTTITVDANGNAVLPDGGITVETGKGTLTITGITGGTAHYTYELNGNIDFDDTAEGGKAAYTDPISLSVSRPGGETAKTDTLTITIVDDRPSANPDRAVIAETAGEKASSVEGNVLAGDKEGGQADIQGADGAKVIGAVSGDTKMDYTGSPLDENGSQTIEGLYGNLVLKADGSYTYTLKTDSVTQDMDNKTDVFTYTIKDSDGDLSHTTLTIELKNTGPAPTNPTPMPGDNPDPGSVKVYETDLVLMDADTTGDKTATDTTVAKLFTGPQEFQSIVFDKSQLDRIKVEGAEDNNFKWEVQGDGTLKGTDGGGTTVVLSIEQGAAKDGTATITATMESAAHHASGDGNIKVTGIAVTGTDAGGSVATNSHVTVTIIDDAPEISAGEVKHSLVEANYTATHNFVVSNDEPASTKDVFNEKNGWTFIDATGKIDPWTLSEKGGSHIRYAYHNGLKILGSSVEYMNTGVVKDWAGHHTSNENPGADEKAGNRYLSLSSDGLSVGGTDSFGSTELIAPGQNNSKYAEALILETENRSVSYGIELELGRFDKGDTAILTFCLTPRNNDDNFSVLQKVITWDSPDLVKGKDGIVSIKVDVPDGFNKIILSAGESTATDNEGFTLREINYNRPYSVHEGKVDVDYGADGGSLAWDWGAAADQLAGGIAVVGTPGAGEYTVKWQDGNGKDVNSFDNLAAGTTLTAVLQGNDSAAVNLHGNKLLTATLGTDGHWVIQQYYNFTLDGKDPQLDFTFNVTDRDGDTAQTGQTVNLASPVIEERFDNVDAGKVWQGIQNDVDNHIGDFLQGKKDDAGNEVNDLLFGRGGNDLLSGDSFQSEDGTALTTAEALKAAFGDAVFGQGNGKVNFETFKNNIEAAKNTSPVDGSENGLDQDIDKISAAMDVMREAGTLDAALVKLEKLEAPDGGDDALFGGLDEDILFGGGGNDYLIGDGQYTTDEYDKEHAGDKSDILVGGSGNDIIVYGEGNDIIRGGSGIDVLLVGKGNDKITLENQSANGAVNGMEVLIRANHTSEVTQLGITSLDALAKYGVVIDSKTHTMSLDMTMWDAVEGKPGHYAYLGGKDITLETNLTHFDTDGSKLVFTEYPPVPGEAEGENGGNVVSGSNVSEPNYIGATANNDTITGNDGDDVIYGDAGASVDHTVTNGIAYDLSQSLGTLTAGTPIRVIKQLIQGNDTVTWWPVPDSTSNQKITSSNQDIIRRLKNFDDAVDSNPAYGKGNDHITGGKGQDIIFGMGGNDYLDGGAGRDILSGGSGNDILVYDNTDYVVYGGKGIDVLLVGNGKNDSTQSKSLQDLLDQDGKSTNQVVAGIEVLLRNTNKDKGAATDMGITSLNDLAAIGVIISGDLLRLDSSWHLKDGKYVRDDMELEIAGLNQLDISLPGGDTVFASPDYSGDLAADLGYLTGSITGTGEDGLGSLAGEAGQQALAGALGGNISADSIRGNAGTVAGALEAVEESSGEVLTGSQEGDVLLGGGGNDMLIGGDGDDLLIGGAGDDVLLGGSGNDVLYGGSGNDVLYGGSGNDVLYGGSGNDVLIGGAGSDTMTGGAGSDTFKWQKGDLDDGSVDKILDFTLGDPEKGGDILDISDLLSGKPDGMTGLDLIKGGYLNFEDIKQNEDGTTTLTVRIDTDGKDGAAQQVDLAQVTMTGVPDVSNAPDPAQAILEQLVNNQEIKF